jgi:transcription termination factor Rho
MPQTRRKPRGAEAQPPEQPSAEPAAQQPSSASAPAENRGLNIAELKEMSIQRLTQVAQELNVAGASGMRKQEVIFQILKAQTE